MTLLRHFKALERKIDRLERAKLSTIQKNYDKILDDLLKSLGKLYEKYEIEGQLTFDEMSKYNRLSQIDKMVKDLGTRLYSENSKLTRETLRRVYEDTYRSTMTILEDGSGRRSIRGILKSQNTTKVVNQDMAGLVWSDRLKKGRSDFIYKLESTIKQGLRDGDRYSTMAKRLRETVGEDINNPNRIIRTEAHRVRVQAKMDVADHASKQGIKMWKIWFSMGDERVRSDHKAMDQVRTDVDEDFVLPDGTRGNPGHTGSASNDINCRCQVRFEFK